MVAPGNRTEHGLHVDGHKVLKGTFLFESDNEMLYNVTGIQLHKRGCMTKIENEIKRLKSKPKDLKFNEISTVLKHLGFVEDNKGKTSGSRVRFYDPENMAIINLHKPHGKNTLSKGAVEDLVDYLVKKGYI